MSPITLVAMSILLTAASSIRLLAEETPLRTPSHEKVTPSRESLASKIDPLFARWNTTVTPGFAVGVIRDGKLIFSRGYGMANLEYSVPITPRSPFYIASMSKQFTAACAALLIQQGKLHLADDVRKYLPELPDYGHRLTIDHLLHHTGGVREWSSLTLFAGQDTRYEHHLDNKDILRLLLRQKSLEFEPGSQYRYSSGGYLLLTEIIERVTGQSLPRFARENLFAPLGMKHTFYDDNYAAILPGRVESYRSLGQGRYERILKHFDVYGDGGIVTTVEDLARWDAVFYESKIGGKGFADLLLTQGQLNSGEALSYAFGLEVYRHNGHKIVEHGGFMLGFTVDMMRFPDDHLTVIALANSSEQWSTGMAFQIADLFLTKPTQADASPAVVSSSVRLSPEQLNRYLGYYWNRESNYLRRVALKNGELVIDWGEGTDGPRLIPIGEQEFLLSDSGNPATHIVFEPRGSKGMHMVYGAAGKSGGFVADRYDPTPPSSLQELEQYAGVYHSEELGVDYRFERSGDRFTLQIGDDKPHTLFPTPDPRFVWNAKNMLWIRFAEVVFQRNKNGNVTGFTVGDQRVSAIHFTRQSRIK